jgi:hypothetical protein
MSFQSSDRMMSLEFQGGMGLGSQSVSLSFIQ